MQTELLLDVLFNLNLSANSLKDTLKKCRARVYKTYAWITFIQNENNPLFPLEMWIQYKLKRKHGMWQMLSFPLNTTVFSRNAVTKLNENA